MRPADQVSETELPGIGRRYDLRDADGRPPRSLAALGLDGDHPAAVLPDRAPVVHLRPNAYAGPTDRPERTASG